MTHPPVMRTPTLATESFAHIKNALETMTDAKLAQSVNLFGQVQAGSRRSLAEARCMTRICPT
jgi:hypothetical protein